MNLLITLPKFSLLAKLTTKPLVFLLVTIPTATVAALPVVDIESAKTLLMWLFFGDLASGVLASYFDWKKTNKKDKWFFGKGEGFSSDKFKKMFVKGSVYLGFPLLVVKFQETFMIKNIKYESISDAEIGIATFCILIFCLNEGYSIFHENLPRCGFNIFDRVKKMFDLFRKTKADTQS